MKIVYLSTDFKPNLGGVAELAYQVCAQLAMRGHDVTVVTEAAKRFDPHIYARFQVERVFDPYPLPGLRSLRGFFRVMVWRRRTVRLMRDAILRRHPNIVLAGNYHGLWIKVLPGLRVPYALFLHGEDVAGLMRTVVFWHRRWDMVRVLRNAGWVFCNSTYSRALVKQIIGSYERASVVGCGYPVEGIVDRPLRQEARARLGWDDAPVILTVARLIFRKGIDTTLKALPEILKHCPSCRYVIVGEGADRAALEQLVGDLGLAGCVSFTGFISDDLKRDIYAASDIYVMPSRPGSRGETEGFGISYLEANALGLPVIGSAAGGIPDAVGDRENGLLVEPGDSVGLAQALLMLLRDPEMRQRMAIKGQQRIRERFNWVKIVEQMEPRLIEAAAGQLSRVHQE